MKKRGIFMLFLCCFFLVGCGEEKCYDPEIKTITWTINIWTDTEYNLKVSFENTNTWSIDWEIVDIVNWNAVKNISLEDEINKVVGIKAENQCWTKYKQVIIKRELTEEEKQAQLQAEEKAKAEKEEEEKRRQQEKIQAFAEKQQKIDLLKSRCRITYDEFNGITRLEPNAIKNTNNQNAIMLYIGKKDDWTIFRRLKIMYADDSWLFIKSYQFSLWWNIISYTPEKIEKDHYTTIWEWSDNYVSTEENNIIEWIIKNNGWKIRHIGSQYHDDRTLGQTEVNAIKDMQELYDLLKEKQNLWL